MTLRLAWATDIHLDFIGSESILEFVEKVNKSKADAFLIGGDISNYSMLQGHLSLLAAAVECPIHFVLGNHDAYGGGIYDSKRIARESCRDHDNLYFLEDCDVVNLTDRTSLVGVGGWADARTGDFFASPRLLNDYFMIRELQFLPDRIARDVLRSLGDAAAERLRSILFGVPAECQNLVVLTHTPCWRAACWHDGRISDDIWSPHFTCVAMGEAIDEFSANRPEVDILVLSGHTHGEGVAQITDRITAKTGSACYGSPEICEIVSVD